MRKQGHQCSDIEVAIKIRGSQGHPRREWVNPEHPFTAISCESDIHANHNQALNSTSRNVFSTTDALNRTTRYLYDRNNRQVREIDAKLGVTKTSYDNVGSDRFTTQYYFRSSST